MTVNYGVNLRRNLPMLCCESVIWVSNIVWEVPNPLMRPVFTPDTGYFHTLISAIFDMIHQALSEMLR